MAGGDGFFFPPGGPGGGASDLDDLTDVDLTTTAPALGDALLFDGSMWVPGAVAGAAVAHSGCTAYRSSTAQSVPNGTWTAVSLNAEFDDTDGYHDNATNPSRLTVPAGLVGRFRAVGQIEWAASSAGGRYLAIYKNGLGGGAVANRVAQTSAVPGSVVPRMQIISPVVQLVAGDYLEFGAYQDTGGALNAAAGINSTWFGIERVAA